MAVRSPEEGPPRKPTVRPLRSGSASLRSCEESTLLLMSTSPPPPPSLVSVTAAEGTGTLTQSLKSHLMVNILLFQSSFRIGTCCRDGARRPSKDAEARESGGSAPGRGEP